MTMALYNFVHVPTLAYAARLRVPVQLTYGVYGCEHCKNTLRDPSRCLRLMRRGKLSSSFQSQMNWTWRKGRGIGLWWSVITASPSLSTRLPRMVETCICGAWVSQWEPLLSEAVCVLRTTKDDWSSPGRLTTGTSLLGSIAMMEVFSDDA